MPVRFKLMNEVALESVRYRKTSRIDEEEALARDEAKSLSFLGILFYFYQNIVSKTNQLLPDS
ncbi:hypothetical protein V7654_10410 [Bacillus sp. JJ1609]|uniref:hypothetical protein n=1 Tax=Bacillus sp. JJ1609 TaxID=3122977 RepID=UPI003000013D